MFLVLLFCAIVLIGCRDDKKETGTKKPEEIEIVATDGLEYCPLNDGTYGVGIGSAKLLTEIVIPSTYNGGDVTTIIDSAFYGCVNITSIKMPSTIRNIGKFAFFACYALTQSAFLIVCKI